MYNQKIETILKYLNTTYPNMTPNVAYNHIESLNNQIKDLLTNNLTLNLGQISNLMYIHNLKYYSLNYNSFNEAETGTQFQSTEGYCGDIYNDLPFENLIINKFELPIPIMKSKAIETSLLSVTFIPSWFLVLDDDFFNFLTKFNTKFQTWKIDVYKKK